MNQLFLGSLIGFAPCALVYLVRGFRAGLVWLALTPLAMASCAAWAIVPDVPRLLGLHALYLRWSFDPRMDIFFWHYRIDLAEADSPWYAAGTALLYALLLAAAWRELARTERKEGHEPWRT